MALIKTPTEIEKMRRGGHLLSAALAKSVKAVRPGVRLYELDRIAEQAIRFGGGTPSFKGYRIAPDDTPFPSTLCVSVNEEMVHGPGDRDRVLKEGDIVGLDIGCWFEGLCTDMAVTVPVGKVSKEAQQLMRVTKQSLLDGMAAAVLGHEVKDISAAIEQSIAPYGYGIVRSLVGHGVGHAVHEEPHVPNFVASRAPRVPLAEGMCLALEPMVSLGDWQVTTADDNWTILLTDGSLGAHFEATIVLSKNGPEILTPLPV